MQKSTIRRYFEGWFVEKNLSYRKFFTKTIKLVSKSQFLFYRLNQTQMKKFSIFVLFLLFTLTTDAQQIVSPVRNMNALSTNDRFQYIPPYDIRDIQLVGERYFFDSLYHQGELKTVNQTYTTEMMYRFDQIEGTIQIKLQDGKEMLVNENDLVFCKLFIEKETVVFKTVSVPNGKKKSVVQVIYESPTLQLYRDSRKYISRAKSASIDGYGSESTYDEVRKKYRYFLRKGKGPFTEVKIEAKSFINVIPEKRSQITQLFRAGQSKGGLTVTKLTQIMTELDKQAN